MERKLTFLDELVASSFGQQLIETYTIAGYLKGTNLSEVVLLEHLSSGQIHVLKAMNAQFGCTIDQNELAKVNHPNLATILQHGESDHYIYSVKPYYGPTTLATYIQKQQPLNKTASIDLIMPIAEALNSLHTQQPMMILRDLKPDNIIITDDNKPIIVDLESSRIYTKKSQDTVILGTPGYASPEHYGAKETDARSDVYILGMLLHFIITSDIWHNRKHIHPRLLHEDMEDLRQIIEKAIAFDPDKRYQSVAALIEAIQSIKSKTFKSQFIKMQKPIPTHMPQTTKRLVVVALIAVSIMGLGAFGSNLIEGIIQKGAPESLQGQSIEISTPLTQTDTPTQAQNSTQNSTQHSTQNLMETPTKEITDLWSYTGNIDILFKEYTLTKQRLEGRYVFDPPIDEDITRHLMHSGDVITREGKPISSDQLSFYADHDGNFHVNFLSPLPPGSYFYRLRLTLGATIENNALVGGKTLEATIEFVVE